MVKFSLSRYMRVVILDGYVDEPTCLGVPPYISPYVRYVAGAIRRKISKADSLLYFTIDQVRGAREIIEVLSEADLLVVICGTTVPGRYLEGMPASPFELRRLLKGLKKPFKVLAGPAAVYGFGLGGGKVAISEGFEDVFDMIVRGDAEVVIERLLEENMKERRVSTDERRRDAGELREYAALGAYIVKQHPNFPFVIAEIETYRGCPRAITGGCSFCTEPKKGLPEFRPVEDVVYEVEKLYEVGVRYFRLGAQPCLFSYMARGVGEKEFPVPNPEAIERLYRGIRGVAPELRTLHMDNANPGVIARYPEESRRIAKIIVRYNTPGDVAAMGIESADMEVIKRNNLKATPEDSLKAISIINEVGRKVGYNGLPQLLPGINFVFGLLGETEETYKRDYEFLKGLLERGLLVRRINLRQVMVFKGTRMSEVGNRIMNKHKRIFKRFKGVVREEIDREMIRRVVPVGTVLRGVLTEKREGKTTFARQLGSYPLLVGIPGVYDLRKEMDVKVVAYGYRSITAVPYPLDVNNAQMEAIMALPGVGERRARRIMRERPFKDEGEFLRVFDDKGVGEKLKEFVSFI
ncbi:MAG: radical SAM protein [Candidatus Methanospirareceae archaeon]